MATIRGTTPIHTFTTDLDLTTADSVFVTYKQDGIVILEKDKDHLTITEDTITYKLTQEETLIFRPLYGVKIQIRAKFADGTAVASNVISAGINDILKEGVI